MLNDASRLDRTLIPSVRPDHPRILIVEDEAIVAEDLSDQLVEMGYEVCGIADNSADAIAMAEQFRPDVVLMDVVIKGDVDGIDTARLISRSLHCPVIFATAYSDPATVIRAAQTSPYGFLTKPYNARDARAAIEVAVYKSTLERQLKESEKWFSSTLRCVADGIIAIDPKGEILFVNPAAESLLHKRYEQLKGSNAVSELQFAGLTDEQHPLHHIVPGNGEDHVARVYFGLRLLSTAGAEMPVDVSVAEIRDGDDKAGVVIALRDVRDRVAAEEALKQSEERFRAAFDFAPIGMALITMEGRFLQTNRALAELLGCDVSELYLANMNAFLVRQADDADVMESRLNQLLVTAVPSVQMDLQLRHSSGSQVDIHATVSLLRKDDMPVCYLFQIYDMTARKEYEAHILQMANYDSLTGLANRGRLSEEIERQIVVARRIHKKFALVFCDLDHFKRVNDTLGHEFGDRLLQAISERMQEAVRESDFVARLGGDEFVILLNNIGSADDAAKAVQKLMLFINQPISIEGRELRVGASFGVSLFPGDGQDATTLLRTADSALYEAKAAGRNGVCFYREELTQRVEEGLMLVTELRSALENKEFKLHYQPIVAVETGAVVAFEALIRWPHPRRGMVSPDKFIPYAEEAGLMQAIGEWVIREACRACAEWNRGRSSEIAVSINVSRSQFIGDTLINQLSSAIEENGLAASSVIVELTEQLLIGDTEHNSEIVERIKAMGASIALDDFGVGYSSLSYIVRFAPDKVKIDRSFTSGVGQGQYHEIMVESIISLSRQMPILTVAEGVETPEQFAFLKSKGCQLVQGYLFSKPVAESDLNDLLSQDFLQRAQVSV